MNRDREARSKHNSTKASKFEVHQNQITGRLKKYIPKRGIPKSIADGPVPTEVVDGFSDFMTLNFILKRSSNNPQFRSTLLSKLRTLCVKWYIEGSFNDLLFNLSIAELSMESKFTPLHYYDLKNAMFYCEEISYENLELYSFHSRSLIRQTNRNMFLKLFSAYMKPTNNKYLDENFTHKDSSIAKSVIEEFQKSPMSSKAKPQEIFDKLLKKFLSELKKQPKIFAADLNLEYILYLVKLGVIDNPNLLLKILQILSMFVDALYEDRLEDVKIHEDRYLNQDDYSQATESDDEDNTVSSESFDYGGSDFDIDTPRNGPFEQEDPPSGDKGVPTDGTEGVGQTDHNQNSSPRNHGKPKFNPDTLIFHSRKKEIEKLATLEENEDGSEVGKPPGKMEIDLKSEDEHLGHMKKLAQVANLAYLVVVTINDLQMGKMFKEFARSPKKLYNKKKNKVKLFFEKRGYLKLAVNIAMKVLGTLNCLSLKEELGIEGFVSNREFRRSIDQMLMTLLSIRNDPLVRSQDSLNPKIDSILLKRSDFVEKAEENFGEIRQELISFFNDTSNSVGSANHRKGGGDGKHVKLRLKEVVDDDVLLNLENIYKKIIEKLEEMEKTGEVLESKIQASLQNIPTLLMSIVCFFVEMKTEMRKKSKKSRNHRGRSRNEFEKSLKRVMGTGVGLIIRILEEGNYLGQSLFFNSKSDYVFWSAAENSPIVFLPILEEVLGQDSSVVFKSARNTEILFGKLQELISHNLKFLDVNSPINFTDEVKDVKRIEIYMALTLLDTILAANQDNSEELLLSAKIHEFLQRNIDAAFMDYFIDDQVTKKINEKYHPVLRKKSFKEIHANIKTILKPETAQQTQNLVMDPHSVVMDRLTHSRTGSDSHESLEDLNDVDKMTNSEIIEAEMHLAFIKLFNEVTESWKHMTLSTRSPSKPSTNELFQLIGFTRNEKVDAIAYKNGVKNDAGDLSIDEEARKRVMSGDEKDIWLYSFDYQIENGVYFITQLIRLYCNEVVFEFSDDLIKMRAPLMLDRVREDAEKVAAIAGMIEKIENSVNSNSKYYDDYKEFLLQGYFKVIYKFLKGVLYELSKVYLAQAQLWLIFEQMTDLLNDVLRRLLPLTKSEERSIGSELYEMIERYINLKSRDKNSFQDRSQASLGVEGHYELKKTRDERYTMIEIILKKIEEIYKIYDRFDIIKDLRRETHKHLQDNPSSIFDDIDATGSNSLKRLEEKFEENKKGYKRHQQNSKISLPEEDMSDSDSEESNSVTQNSRSYNQIGQLTPRKVDLDAVEQDNDQTLKHMATNKSIKNEVCIHAKGCLFMNYYIKIKQEFLFEEDSLFFKVMDEGGDDGTEPEELYRLFLTWIIELFHHKLNPKESKFTHPDSNYSVILRDFQAFSWIHILDNIMTTKPSIREILFSKFYTESFRIKEEALKANPDAQTAYLDFTQYQKSKIGSELELEEQKIKLLDKIVQLMIIKGVQSEEGKPGGEDLLNDYLKSNKPMWSEEKLRRRRKNIMKADIFLSSLFETSFYLQRRIRSEVFSRTFTLNLEYYFSLAGLIKTIAEDNFMDFKELVGRMRKPYIRSHEPEKKEEAAKRQNAHKRRHSKLKAGEGQEGNRKVTINYLDCLYKGVYLHTKVSHDLDELVRRDRPHLFWYNIVTLDTLSEYFNGPCEYNQNNSIKKFKKLLMYVSRLNRNEYNTFYLLQLEIINMVQALFEGRNRNKCKRINKNFKPFDFYNMIVKHLEVVYKLYLKEKYRKEYSRNRFSRYLVEHYGNNNVDDEGDNFEPGVVRRRLLKFYKHEKNFQKHPILNTAVGLFMIMQTIAKGNNKTYLKYLSGKRIEMAVELGLKTELKLNQSERVKVEQQSKKSKNPASEEAEDAGFLGIGIFKRRKKGKKKKRKKKGSAKSNIKQSRILSLMGGEGNPLFFGRAKAEEDEEERVEQTRLKNLTYFFFLTQITASIEIVNRQREPVTVYFQILPECMFLTKETKNLFMDSCTYTDANSKLMFLMERVPYFKVEMKSNHRIYQWIGSFSKMANESTFFAMMRLTWVISLLVNISVLLGYRWNDPPEGSEATSRFEIMEPYNLFNLIFGIMLIVISFLFLLLWIGFKYRFAVQQASQSFKKQEGKGLFYFVYKYIYLAFLQQPIPMMFLLHIVFTFLGLYGSPLSHSLNLHCLFFLSETVQYVVKAVTSHIEQVLMTLLVGVLLTYSFSILNTIDFRYGWDPFTGDEKLCTTMLGCFGYVLDFGLRNGGGIADSHDTVEFVGEHGGYTYWYKIGFNLLFFILISKFVLDIIFGIIVDSFTDMRDNQQKRGKF